MKALIQRVTQAGVVVEGNTIGQIKQGLLVLLGVDKHDDQTSADKLLHKLLHYRVFADAEGKMNLNVQQINGGLLIVSQFTLSADTRKGLRPSFSSAATPEHANAMYEYLLAQARELYEAERIAQGQFGADMQVSLINDGPVTFMLES